MHRDREKVAPGARLLAFALTGLVLATALRGALLVRHWDLLEHVSVSELTAILGTGLRLDAVVIAYLMLPAWLLWALPRRDTLVHVYTGAALALLMIGVVVEYEFFAYYGFRANYLVVDHALDLEVMRTVGAHVASLAKIATILAIFALGWLSFERVSRRIARAGFARASRGRRLLRIAAPVLSLPLVALAARGTIDHRPINPSLAMLGPDRFVNELAGSGLLNVAYEVSQRLKSEPTRLASLHPRLPPEEARRRVRRLLGGTGTFAEDEVNPFVRVVKADSSGDPAVNVVIVVMESFTGRLVGALGGAPALSPSFDAIAREGFLLTRCYASGERTVQGLEAVLSSFPPLPGPSVVRRSAAQHGFATLASVLGERGYDTVFLYGGQGIFDSMRGFFLGNGYRAFIEERDFEAPQFRGSWGVSDEDLFHRANREFQARWEAGRPFLGTILTVSLHSPWEFPDGRAPSLPPDVAVPWGFTREELQNYLYADYAIGEFVREARSLPYAAETLFVFVGDHGVHLRARELLPSEEYRVPALFWSPGLVEAGTDDTVTSQLDLAPTTLGFIGGEFRSPFFGRDVRAAGDEDGFAVMIYNKRRYGVRRGDRLTVLPEHGEPVGYTVPSGGKVAMTELTSLHEEDAADALSMLQVAEELLESRRFSTRAIRAQESTNGRARALVPAASVPKTSAGLTLGGLGRP